MILGSMHRATDFRGSFPGLLTLSLRARAAAPAVISLDALDGLAPASGVAGSGSMAPVKPQKMKFRPF